MAKKKQQPAEAQNVIIRAYKDVVGRIIKVFKNPITREYTISAHLYDRQGQAISLLSYSYPNRKSCFEALKRYPKEKREELQ